MPSVRFQVPSQEFTVPGGSPQVEYVRLAVLADDPERTEVASHNVFNPTYPLDHTFEGIAPGVYWKSAQAFAFDAAGPIGDEQRAAVNVAPDEVRLVPGAIG